MDRKNYQALTLAKLQTIVDTYRHLPPRERLDAYITHITTISNYDFDRRKKLTEIIKAGDEPNIVMKKKEMLRYLETGKGLCGNFSQALSLVCSLDGETPPCHYAINFVNNSTLGHAYNIVLEDGCDLVIDISSLVHWKEGDYKKTDAKDYIMRPHGEFVNSIAKEGVELSMKNEPWIIGHNHYSDTAKYYNILNFNSAGRAVFEERIDNQVMLAPSQLREN
jgi:hypothetical protein